MSKSKNTFLSERAIRFYKGVVGFFLATLTVSICAQSTGGLAINHIADSLELYAPGMVSTDLYERDFALSSDRNEIMYTLGTYDQSRRCIVFIRRTGNGWTERTVANFSGIYQDIEPFYSVDGKQLFFASDRPLPGETVAGDYNIWKCDRVNAGWSEPIPVSNQINEEGNEYYPSVSRNGNLYFTAARTNGIGREDIFVSKYVNGSYQKPEVLDTNVNSVRYEFNAYVSPDEDLLVFTSYGRPDDLGGGDLYYCRKNANGSWDAANHLGNVINSNKLDYCPFVDAANGNLYFTSERSAENAEKINSTEELQRLANSPLNGMGNIYRIGLKEIESQLKH